MSQITLGDITVDVVLKDIKNVHLSVHPPAGRVRIAAPKRMRLDTIRVFAVSKLDWIRLQQRRLRDQERETRREYVERESHYVWGRRVLLKVRELDGTPEIELRHNRLLLRVRPGTHEATKEALVARWYRQLLKAAVSPLIDTWAPRLGVRVNGFHVQRMKTRWGSCNHKACTIRLNTELAKKPKACLEYLVVHEMVHLIDPTHGPRFVSLMNRFLPAWRDVRTVLNRLPARHEEWRY